MRDFNGDEGRDVNAARVIANFDAARCDRGIDQRVSVEYFHRRAAPGIKALLVNKDTPACSKNGADCDEASDAENLVRFQWADRIKSWPACTMSATK